MTAYYYIIPAKITGIKTKKIGKKLKVTWKKGSAGITGYEIAYTKPGKVVKKSYTVKGRSKTSKKIKYKKGYYVSIRAYKKLSEKTIYGKWETYK